MFSGGGGTTLDMFKMYYILYTYIYRYMLMYIIYNMHTYIYIYTYMFIYVCEIQWVLQWCLVVLGKNQIEWAKKQQSKIISNMLQRFISQNVAGWRLLFVEIEFISEYSVSQADHSTEQFAGIVLLKFESLLKQYILSRGRTYPTLRKGESSTQKCRQGGDMLVRRRVCLPKTPNDPYFGRFKP